MLKPAQGDRFAVDRHAIGAAEIDQVVTAGLEFDTGMVGRYGWVRQDNGAVVGASDQNPLGGERQGAFLGGALADDQLCGSHVRSSKPREAGLFTLRAIVKE